MSAKGEMKRFPYALSCFGGSSVSDEMPDEVKSRRRSARSLSEWSRSGAKKKTVPLDYEEDIDNAQKMKDIPSAKVSATKKCLFQKFHKDKSNKQLQNQWQATTSYKSPACHVTTKCDTQAQTVTLFQEPVHAAQMKIKVDRTGSPTKPTPSPAVPKVQNKKKKKTKGGEIYVGLALIALAMTLVTMLVGGRSLAIMFTSIGFYIFPSISTTAMTSKRNKTYSIEMCTSLGQYNVKCEDFITRLSEHVGKDQQKYFIWFHLVGRRYNAVTVL